MRARVFRLLVLFLCSSLEVRVKADEWLQDPRNCQLQEKNCLLRAERQKSALSALGLLATKETLLIGLGGFRVKLVKGSMFAELGTVPEVSTIFGSVSGSGKVVVERKETSTRFTCLEGEMNVITPDRKKTQALSSGLWVEFGSRGPHDVEIPQVIARQAVIELWWRHYDGSKAEFKNQIRPLLEALPEKAENLAGLQGEMVQRSVASQAAADQLKREGAEREAREQAKMRALFRKENYLGEEIPQ